MSHEFEKVIKDIQTAAIYIEPNSVELRAELVEILGDLKPKNHEQAFAQNAAKSMKLYSQLLGVDELTLSALIIDRELHEIRSLRILDELKWQPTRFSQPIQIYRNLLFKIAYSVLLLVSDGQTSKKLPPSTVLKFFKTLKGIISGQLEADRLDYVIRDPKISGLETGIFDLNRIVRSFVLGTVEDAEGEISFAPGIKALTAIEAFFHQRYLTYKSLIYHKGALRTKSVFRETLKIIIAFSVTYPNHEISKICARSGLLELNSDDKVHRLLPESASHYVELDDARLRTLFFDVLRNANDSLSNWDFREGSEPDGRRLLPNKFGAGGMRKILTSMVMLLQTFLFRKKENLFTIDINYVAVHPGDRDLVNSGVRFTLERSEAFQNARSEFSEALFLKFWWLLSLAKIPKVYDPLKDKLFVHNGEYLVPAETRSPYLAMQAEMAPAEPRFIVSVCLGGVRYNTQRKNEIEAFAQEYWSKVFSDFCSRKDQSVRESV